MTQKPISQNNGQYTTPPKTTGKSRVDYVDLLKGITILWVIWIHSDHPDFGNFRMPVFFFASGIFFKLSDPKSFFTKRWYSFIIPFLFFYIASIPFEWMIDLWDYRTLDAFDWNRIMSLFSNDGLLINPPLWFLLVLFFIQSLSYVVFRLNKSIIWILCIASLFFHEELLGLPCHFMIKKGLAYFGYFGLGYLIGKPMIKLMCNLKRKTMVFIATLAVLFISILYLDNGLPDYHFMIERIKQIAFTLSFMTFFSFFDGVKWLGFLRFYGKESLIVLGTHQWFLIPIRRVVFKFIKIHNPIIGFFMAALTAVILYPVIKFLNKKIPVFVGKRKNIEKGRLKISPA